jgi:hypothetical protein
MSHDEPAHSADTCGACASSEQYDPEEEDPEEALSYRLMVARAALQKAADSALKHNRPAIERALRALEGAVPRLEDQL